MNPEKDTPTNTPAQGNNQVAPVNSANESSQSSVKNSPTPHSVKDALLSNQIANEPVLKEESFGGGVPKQVLQPNPTPTKHHAFWKNLVVPAAAILILLALGFGGYAAWRNANQQAKDASVAERFGSTTFDLNNLNPSNTTANSGLVVINGNEQVNGNLAVEGSVTADSFSGNGSGLTGVNAEFLDSQPGSFYQDASNLDSGTLNDARLSGNVVLLGDSPSFGNLTVSGSSNLLGPVTIQNILLATGAVTFQSTLNVAGDVTIGGDTNINGLSYAWPDLQGNGVLSNDGSGNLAWQPVGACATCLTDGGNAFGTSISVGTNDANSLQLRTNGSTQVTVTTTGDVGIGLNPGYKLDVNGDINVSAGNVFRIGGTAICTSGGCAASAGSTDYVQNSASLQTGVNFNFEIASINSVGGIIRAKAGQVSDLQQWQDSGGVALAAVDAGGHFVATTLGATDTATYLCRNSSNQIAACSGSASGAAFVQGGNSFGATATLGTNDANGLAFETNNTVRVTIPSGTNGFTFGAAGDTNLYRLAAGTLATDSILSVRDATDTYVNINPNGTITLAETLGPTSATLDYSHLGFSDSSSYVQVGSSAATTGAARLSNTGAINWRNAANSANIKGITVTSSDVVQLAASVTTNDSSATVSIGTTGTTKKGLVIQGVAGQTSDLQEWQNSSGTVLARIGGAGQLGLNNTSLGTNIRLAVNASATQDNTAAVQFNSANTTDNALVVQGMAGQTANLQEWQNSSGTALAAVDASGRLGVGITSSMPAKLAVVGSADENQFILRANGTQTSDILKIQNNNGGVTYVQINSAGQLQVQAGSASAPSITATGISGTGIYFAASGQVNIGYGSAERFRIAMDTSNTDLLAQSGNNLRFGTSASGVSCTISNTNGSLSCPGAGSSSERFGSGSLAAGSNSLAVGNGASAANNESVSIGYGAASTGTNSTALGRSSTAGQDSVGLGYGASASFSNSIAIGRSAATTASNQLVVGSTSASITSAYFGNGVTAASPAAFTLNATGGSGTDIAGASLTLAAGRGTGNAAGGSILFQTTSSGQGTGSTARTLTTVASLSGTDGAATFTNIANSTTAFQVQRSGGGSTVLTVDTTNEKVTVNKQLTVSGGSTVGGPANAVLVTGGRTDEATTLTLRNTAADTNLGTSTLALQATRTASSAAFSAATITAGEAVDWVGNASDGYLSVKVLKTESLVERLRVSSDGAVGLSTATFGTNNRLTVNPNNTTDNLATAQINANAATNKGLVVQGYASQSADLQQWQNSSGTVLSSANSSGLFNFGTSSNYIAGNAKTFTNGTAIHSTTSTGQNWTVNGVTRGTQFFSSEGTVDLGSPGSINLAGDGYSGYALPTLGGYGFMGSYSGARGSGSRLIIGAYNTAQSTSTASGDTVYGTRSVASFSSDQSSGSVSQDAYGVLGSASTSTVSDVTSTRTAYGIYGTATSSGLRTTAYGGLFTTSASGTGTNIALQATAGTADTTGLIVKAASSQTANLTEWRNSSNTVLSSIDSSGNLTVGSSASSSGAVRLANNASIAWRNAANSGNIALAVNSGDNLTTSASSLILGNGGTPATTGALRLNNNTTLAWRNAGDTGNVTAGVNASDIFQVTSPAADGSTVAQFNNAGATNCTVQPGGTGFACSSDERLKTNIMNLESGDATELVNKLQGVSFNWITNPDGQTQVGFVAQDLMKYIPSAVSQDSTGHYVANYSAIIPYLVEAFKKQQTQIDTLKSQNGTSVDVLKTLADAKAVTLTGDLTVGGNVVVKGHVGVGKDTAGTATLPAGQTSVHVGFGSAYKKAPKVTLSVNGDPLDGGYSVKNITTTGFDIVIKPAQSQNVDFNWTAVEAQ